MIRIPTLMHKVLPIIRRREELKAKLGELPTMRDIRNKMRDIMPTTLLIYVKRTPLRKVSQKYYTQLWASDKSGFFSTSYKKEDKKELVDHIRKAVTSMFEDNFPGNIGKNEAKRQFLKYVPTWVQGILNEEYPTLPGQDKPMWFTGIYNKYKAKARGSASIGSAQPCPGCNDRDAGNRHHDWQTGDDICKCGCVLQSVRVVG